MRALFDSSICPLKELQTLRLSAGAAQLKAACIRAVMKDILDVLWSRKRPTSASAVVKLEIDLRVV